MRKLVVLGLGASAAGCGASLLLEAPLALTSLFVAIAIVLLIALLPMEQAIEPALSANEGYMMMLNQLPLELFAVLDGKVQFTNEAWQKKHGHGCEGVFDKFTPKECEELIVALRQAESDHKPFATLLRANNGTKQVYYEAHGTPVTNGQNGLLHVLVFCVDVTPIVNAKEEAAQKHDEIEVKNSQLNAALRQIEMNIETLVDTMVRAVEIKDPYTAGHSVRVKQYSVWIGKHLGLSAYELRTLEHGANIHDVGKIGVPDAILVKPGSLTPEEYEVIKLHPSLGEKMVRQIEMFRDCLPIVRWHHERLDGSGYPDGLVGEDIPFLARVVAVADVFDALTSNRSYRQQMDIEIAMQSIAKDVADGKLDAIAYKALRHVIAENGMIAQSDTVTELRAS